MQIGNAKNQTKQIKQKYAPPSSYPAFFIIPSIMLYSIQLTIWQRNVL